MNRCLCPLSCPRWCIVAKRLNGSRCHLVWTAGRARARPRRWPSSPQKGHSPQFSAHVFWPNGWMDQDATWYIGQNVLHGTLPPKRGTADPDFSAHVYYGQTVALLSNCWALDGLATSACKNIHRDYKCLFHICSVPITCRPICLHSKFSTVYLLDCAFWLDSRLKL